MQDERIPEFCSTKACVVGGVRCRTTRSNHNAVRIGECFCDQWIVVVVVVVALFILCYKAAAVNPFMEIS
jgi:hypothetical protein